MDAGLVLAPVFVLAPGFAPTPVFVQTIFGTMGGTGPDVTPMPPAAVRAVNDLAAGQATLHCPGQADRHVAIPARQAGRHVAIPARQPG